MSRRRLTSASPQAGPSVRGLRHRGGTAESDTRDMNHSSSLYNGTFTHAATSVHEAQAIHTARPTSKRSTPVRILQAQQEEIRRPLGEGNGSVKYYLKSTVREEDESLARSMDDSGASSSASHHSGAETSMDSFSHEDNYVRRARQAAGGRSTARREMSKTAQARLGKTDDDLYQVDEDDDEDSEGDDGLEMDVPRSHYTRQTRAQAAPPSVRDMTPRATRMAVPESPPRVTISSAKGTQQVLPAGYTTRRRSEPRSKSPLYHDGGHWWQSLKSLNTRALIRRWWKMALGLAMCVLWLLYISSRSRSSTPDTPSTSGSPTTPDHDNTPESARRPQSPSYATPPLSNSADWRKLENQVHDLTRLVEELTKRRVPAVEQSVASLGSRVDILEREIRNAFDEGQATEWLRRILPSALPVRYDGDGNIHIEPSVYTALNKVLLGEHALERHVREAIMTGRFDEAYESAVERIFGIDSHAGSLATRNEVVKLISTEVQSLELKLRADRKQTAVDIKHGGKDVTPAIQALIDAALLKFSKDMGTGRDYALYSAGGRILPTHTTDTMAVALVPSWASWLKGTPTVLGRDPSTILTPRSTNNVGVCWPFVGDAGQAGVKLARRIVVTAISLEHAPSELVMGIDSAPKNVEIWASVEGEQDRIKAAQFLENVQSAEYVHSEQQKMSEELVQLASLVYDASSPTFLQTFPVRPEILALGIETEYVIVKFTSNWGGDYTCVYRVRVHGYEMSPEVAV